MDLHCVVESDNYDPLSVGEKVGVWALVSILV